jgi:hypothetical protein
VPGKRILCKASTLLHRPASRRPVASSPAVLRVYRFGRLLLRKHFFDSFVVAHDGVVCDKRRYGSWLNDCLLNVRPSECSYSLHGLPSSDDQKLNLVIEFPLAQMRTEKSRHLAKLRGDIVTKMLRVRLCSRSASTAAPLTNYHTSASSEQSKSPCPCLRQLHHIRAREEPEAPRCVNPLVGGLWWDGETVFPHWQARELCASPLPPSFG